MKIQVDFYKPSGKWHEGGEVEIGNARLWKGDLPQAIVNNQNILTDGWQHYEYYYVITNDIPELFNDPNYKEFFKALFKPEIFGNLYKQ
jgi:hypothetical protein